MSDRPLLRRIRPEFLLLLASIAVALLLAEAVLRVHYVATYSGTLEDLRSDLPPPEAEVALGHILAVSAYPRLVYQLKPHLDAVRLTGVSISTNSQGFRERSEPGPREEGTIRIVGLGDSVMFGHGVEEDERYMDVLERRLDGRFPDHEWETITIAVPGYNLVMEVEALERYGLAYEPDLLIYGFIGNDLCVPNFVGRRRSVWALDSFINYYWDRSGAGELLVLQHDAALENHGLPAGALRARDRDLYQRTYCAPQNFAPEHQFLVGEENFQRALAELAEIGEKLGVPTVLLNFRPPRALGGTRRPESIVFIDLSRRFRDYLEENGYARYRESDLALAPDDAHPTAKAHRMIGSELADRLVELGVVDEILARRRPPS